MEFRVLGPLEVVDETGILIAVGGHRPRAVLAALLTSPRKTITTDALIDAVWPTSPPQNPRKALQVLISRLRAALGHDRIGASAAGYWFEPGDTGVDAAVIKRAAEGDGDPCQALSLWRGQPFAEVANWLPARAASAMLEELRSTLAVACMDQDIARSEYDLAVGQAEGLLVTAPHDERLWIGLARALSLNGRQRDAVSACQRARTAMADVGLLPSPALIEIEQEVLAHEPGAPATPLPGLLAPLAGRPFSGREVELDGLRRRWSEARRRQTQLVLITGEPGIGKSHLAAEFASQAATDRPTVLFGSASPQGPALEGLAEALNREIGGLRRLRLPPRDQRVLGRIVPDLAEPMPTTGDGDHDRAELALALGSALEAWSRRRPVLLVLDDLHWAGRSTLRALSDLVRARSDLALMIIVTMRDVPPDTSTELDELRAELLRHGAAWNLRLDGLKRAAVKELLSDADDDIVDAVAIRTAGNPLFVTQLATTGTVASNPNGDLDLDLDLAEMVEHRVRRLGAEVDSVLRTAAVIGEQFDLDIVLDEQDDVELATAALSEAEAARLIQAADDHGRSMRFHHAVVREVLYRSLPAASRAQSHASIAVALERLRPASKAAGRVAWHLSHAGPFTDVDACVDHARLAAAGAATRAAHAEAAEHLALPLVLDGLDERRRCELLVEKAELEGAAGLDGPSIVSSNEATAIAQRHGWDDHVARAALSWAPTSGRWLRLSGAEGAALAKLALAGSVDDNVTRQRLILRYMSFASSSISFDERRVTCDAALDELRRHGSPMDYLLGLSDTYWALQNILRPPVDIYDELEELGRSSHSSPRHRWWAFMADFARAWYQQDLAGYGRDRLEWRVVSDSLGPVQRYWSAISTSSSSVVDGRIDHALELVATAYDHADSQLRHMWSRAHAPGQLWLANVLADVSSKRVDGSRQPSEWPAIRGDHFDVMRLLIEPRAEFRPSTVALGWRWAEVGEGTSVDEPAGNVNLSLAGLGAIATGDRATAATIYAKLEPIAELTAGTAWNPLPVTHFILGRLSEFLGHHQTAIDHVTESGRLHRNSGAPALVALSDRALAQLC